MTFAMTLDLASNDEGDADETKFIRVMNKIGNDNQIREKSDLDPIRKLVDIC